MADVLFVFTSSWGYSWRQLEALDFPVHDYKDEDGVKHWRDETVTVWLALHDAARVALWKSNDPAGFGAFVAAFKNLGRHGPNKGQK